LTDADGRSFSLGVAAENEGYLVDADQNVALAYEAACTPDFFLFDNERKLVYRGQLAAASNRNQVTRWSVR